MTEATITTKKLPELHIVEGFDPMAFARVLINDDGSKHLYLDVKYRILWFRLANPNGKIDPEVVHMDDKCAVVCCRLYADKADAADQYIAKSTAQRFASEEKFGDRFLEAAETAAIGRALAAAGFGTQFCSSGDLGGDVIADAPIDLPFDTDSEIKELPNKDSTSHTVPAPPIAQAEETKPKPKAVAPKSVPQPTTLDEWVDFLSIEDAKSVTVDIGRYTGTTLGEIAMLHPADLGWYAEKYAGRNLKLKAGAMILMRAALEQAS